MANIEIFPVISLENGATLIILTFIWRCPIFLISQQIGVFQNSKVKKRQLPIFFMGNWLFFTGNWRFFTFEF